MIYQGTLFFTKHGTELTTDWDLACCPVTKGSVNRCGPPILSALRLRVAQRALNLAMTDDALRLVMGQRVQAMGQRVRTIHSQRHQTWVGRRAPICALTDGALRPGVGRRAPTRAMTDGAIRPEVGQRALTQAMTDGDIRLGSVGGR